MPIKGEGVFQRRILGIVRDSIADIDGRRWGFISNDPRAVQPWIPDGYDPKAGAIFVGDLREQLFGERNASFGQCRDLQRALDALVWRERIYVYPVLAWWDRQKGRETRLIQYRRNIAPS